MIIRSFITHKEAEKYEDCQDFFSISVERKSVAVSDGMSESIFPNLWAQILSKAFAQEGIHPSTIDNVESLRSQWLEAVNSILEQKKKNGENPWRLEGSLACRNGAGATLCGVDFSGTNYAAYVLGDSCIISVDTEDHITGIIRSEEGEFGNRPDYFDSFQGGKGIPKIHNGELRKGEKLLLVTDALSDFLYLKYKENVEQSSVAELGKIRTNQEFEDLVREWRREDKMHNDDTTLVYIEGDDTEDFVVKNEVNLFALIEQEKEQNNATTSSAPSATPETASTLASTEENRNVIQEPQQEIATSPIVDDEEFKNICKELISWYDEILRKIKGCNKPKKPNNNKNLKSFYPKNLKKWRFEDIKKLGTIINKLKQLINQQDDGKIS